VKGVSGVTGGEGGATARRHDMTFELGINYWPRRRAMYMWIEHDLAEVRDEMAHIADLGFDVVRLFLLTRDFLPGPRTVDAAMVGRLVDVCRVASDAGLRVVPTLVVLNMSGRVWWPDWMRDARGEPRDLYADPVLRAQELLAESCARALAGSGAIRAFDLSNEIDDAQRPRTREAGAGWALRLATAIRRHAPGVPIQIGAHLPSLSAANNMRVDDLAAVADEDVMHAYPLYSDVARGFLDPELVPFSCVLTSELAGSGRPTLMQELGLCTAPPGMAGTTITDDFLGAPRAQYLASEEEGARYYEEVLERLVRTDAAGAYAWCYADYDPRLFDRPPLASAIRERTFGLVRADGTEKPAAELFRALRARRDAGTLGTAQPVARLLDVSADEYYRDPAHHFARLYARWTARA
jgi:endo-1,4-beta-mannosidase